MIEPVPVPRSATVDLVAHSVGATILISSLAQGGYAAKIPGVFLVAPPFVGEGGWPSQDMDMEPMEQLGTKLPYDAPIYLYHGGNDDTVRPRMSNYTRRRFRKRRFAGSIVPTISSTTICPKWPPMFAGLARRPPSGSRMT